MYTQAYMKLLSQTEKEQLLSLIGIETPNEQNEEITADESQSLSIQSKIDSLS